MLKCLILFIVASASAFIQTVAGFGAGISLMIFLPKVFDMKTCTALTGLICLPMILRMFIRYRKYARPKTAFVPIISYILCNYICLSIVANINLDNLKAIFGLFLFALSLYFFFIADNIKIKVNVASGIICGAVSGLTSAFFGVGGPMLALYLLTATDDKNEYFGTANLAFAIAEICSSTVRIVKGILSPDYYILALVLMVFIILGNTLGCKVADRINSEQLKKIVYCLLAVSGLSTFVSAIL